MSVSPPIATRAPVPRHVANDSVQGKRAPDSAMQSTLPPATPKLHGTVDWQVWLGLALSLLWLGLALLYIRTEIGWALFAHLHPDSLGQFLDGAFAPLAFMWLVIGYFLQQKEIADNTAALRAQSEQIQLSARQAVRQSELIEANELHARQETFLRIATQVRGQLGTIMGMLWISSQGVGSGNSGGVSGAEQSRMFAQLSQNDTEVFSRRMLEINLTTPESDRYALFYGTATRARHSNHFIVTFERLLARAVECDPDGMIVASLQYNGHGLVYRIAKSFQAQAPAALADPGQTGLFIDMATTRQP